MNGWVGGNFLSARFMSLLAWEFAKPKKTMRYLDMLPDLVYSYNHSEHRSIGRPPALVNLENEDEVFRTLYHNVL